MKYAQTMVLAILLASLGHADEYSLEPIGGGRALLKGEDGIERAVVVVSLEEYELLTNRLEATWRVLNSTHESRCRLHGKPKVPAEIDETLLVKRTTYADGYIYEEPLKKKERLPKLLNVEMAPRRPGSMSARQWNARKARARAAKAKRRRVFAEFAPGGKVMSATEVEPEPETKEGTQK